MLITPSPSQSGFFPRVLELTYTAWDLEPFARDVLDEIQTAPHDSEPGFAAYWKLYSSHSPSATGRSPPPFIWDEERRFWLRAELDALFFHLYLPADADGEWRIARREDGAVVDETAEQLAELKHYFPTPRDAVEYIMETFPIVKRKDIAQFGTYRTKEAILGIYDAMQESIRTGRPYQTRLDPPPADPRVAHQ
ncbi:MAG: hypothetical protein KatS3mg110_3215 [Pirellulaceae bacterium]|nr:MAG: hypothetical protein KatS3mg110_3215 [Pirellulaceae bacterium]